MANNKKSSRKTKSPNTNVVSKKEQLSTKKTLIIYIFLGVLIFTGLGAGGYWFYDTQIKESQVEDTQSTDDDDKRDDQQSSIDQGGEDQESQDDESSEDIETKEEDTKEEPETQYLEKRYECSGYASLDQEKEAYMVIVYPEYVELQESENPNADCDLTLGYKSGSLKISYTVGEAYPSNLKKDYETIKNEDGITLVRNPLQIVDRANSNPFYMTSYVELLDESECQPNEMFEDLRPPCGLRANPFVTNSGLFYLEIPQDTPLSERTKILEVFDEVARRSYGGKM
jgi:hypothetical protein